MNEEKKLALLIDSDNVSAKYAQFILQEAGKYGELTYKRIYGDWEKGGNGWHYPALNNSIMPVQQTSYIAGKNATDFSMIIDAMDILYTGDVDGFVLVTSDSDFTRLAIRLREAGKLVVGIGEVKTPLAFTSSCHHFSYLNQVCEPVPSIDEKALRKAVLDYVTENDDGKLDLGKVSAHITSKFGNIDYDMLGYNRFSAFIDSFTELKRTGTFITLKKNVNGTKSSKSENLHSAAEIVSVISEYLNRNKNAKNQLSQVEEYINVTLGKVDYSRFGSKRFAKFIDGCPEFKREGNVVCLAGTKREIPAEPEAPATTPAVEETEPEKPTITLEEFAADVEAYASENMPKGGNMGQLNNLLMEKYGKSYISDLGFNDFASAVLAVKAVRVAANHVFTGSKRGRKFSKPVLTDNTAKKPVAEKETFEDVTTETPNTAVEEPESIDTTNEVSETPETEKQEKLDINLIKREIQAAVAQSNKGIELAKLGKILKKQYGDDYLQQLGYKSLKKLLGNVAGINLSLGKLYIDEAFVKRTEEIENFVKEFVRKEGKCSVKALSNGIRKEFENFDYADYGYTKFTDFINAIDGVKATRYYVEAE